MLEMTCYHGSEVPGLTRLNPSRRGTLGFGFYFTLNADEAAAYGDHVYEAKVTLKKPWIISVEHDSELAIEMNFDSPSIAAVLSLPGGDRLVKQAKETDGLYGGPLQDLIREAGFDGIVATYPDGCAEVVAYEQRQISDLQVYYAPDIAPAPGW